MKRRKLVGITIIVASLLMQIGYATSAGQIGRTVSTKEMAVKFMNNPVVSHDQNIDVVTTVDEGVVNIAASNLYPGGRFSVISTIENKGEYDAVVTGIELVEKQGEGLSHELFTKLVGYQSNQSVEDYNTYLKNTYVGKAVQVGKTLDIPLVMGMAIGETGLQNQKTQFSLLIHFQQEEGTSGGGGNGGGNDSDKDPDQDTVTPDKDVPKQEVPILPEEMPVEEGAVLPEEVPVEAEVVLPEDIPVEEELTLPKGGLLPKTGGVTPILVYGIGIALLGSGIIIYRKKDE